MRRNCGAQMSLERARKPSTHPGRNHLGSPWRSQQSTGRRLVRRRMRLPDRSLPAQQNSLRKGQQAGRISVQVRMQRNQNWKCCQVDRSREVCPWPRVQLLGHRILSKRRLSKVRLSGYLCQHLRRLTQRLRLAQATAKFLID